jgi:hypothetical protein
VTDDALVTASWTPPRPTDAAARSFFHFFSCAAGGTVLDFVAAMEGCCLFEAAQKRQAMTCTADPLTLTEWERSLVLALV